jgi:uncharacterized MAPEG superfamily protein
MTQELYWLTLVTLLTGLMWIPYILNWIVEHGIIDALWRPQNYDHSQPRAHWAARMLRAHENAVENLVIFATLVLILTALNVSTSLTVAACVVYFWARLAHFLSFTFAVPGMRVLTFLVGFGAQMALVVEILY